MALTRQPSRNVLVLQNSGAEVSTAQNISPFYQWVVNGELTFPQVESQDALQQVDASFLIHEVRVSAKTAGTSTYNIRILSHDVNGGSEVVLVDEAIIFSVDKGIHLLPLQTANVPENSTLEMTIFEQTVGTPAKDVTASLIGQPFTGLTPLQNGHKIQDNLDVTYAQRDNLKFDNHFGVADDLVNDQTDVTFTESSLDSYVDNRATNITTPLITAAHVTQFEDVRASTSSANPVIFSTRIVENDNEFLSYSGGYWTSLKRCLVTFTWGGVNNSGIHGGHDSQIYVRGVRVSQSNSSNGAGSSCSYEAILEIGETAHFGSAHAGVLSRYGSVKAISI